MSAGIDYTGKVIGKLTAVRVVPRPYGTKRQHRHWEMRCECGGTIVIRSSALSGSSKGQCRGVHWCMECRAKAKRLYGVSIRKPLRGDSVYKTVFTKYRANAERNGRSFLLTFDEFKDIVSGRCHYCDAPPVASPRFQQKYKDGELRKCDVLVNGVDRLDSSEGYVMSNCVPCCATCNYAKRVMSPGEFIAWVRRVAYHTRHIALTDTLSVTL